MYIVFLNKIGIAYVLDIQSLVGLPTLSMTTSVDELVINELGCYRQSGYALCDMTEQNNREQNIRSF